MQTQNMGTSTGLMTCLTPVKWHDRKGGGETEQLQIKRTLRNIQTKWRPNGAHLEPHLYKFNGKITLLRHLGKSEHGLGTG